jgi:signal transduction histidine kinase
VDAGTADNGFARLVSLACHDLRTPLATVHGFARTLQRVDDLPEQAARYIEFMAAATQQLADLLDDLSLVARIEAGRYEPNLQSSDTLALARVAVDSLDGKAEVTGTGAPVVVDVDATEDALCALTRCALRHGGLQHIDLTVDGAEVRLAPIVPEAAPIVLGEDLRDLGAAVAVRVLRRLGGTVDLDGDALRVVLPTT